MIKAIEFKKLFGRFDYYIEFHNDITILTGPNGFGKSTVLRAIEAISNGNIFYFITFDFEEFLCFFDNNKKIEIKKTKKYLSINGEKIELEKFFNINHYLHRYNALIGDNKLNISNLEEIVDSDFEIIEDFKFGYFLPKMNIDFIKILQKFKFNSKYITEQRLINIIRDKNKNSKNHLEKNNNDYITENVIDTIPNKMIELITSVSNEYSQTASKLDSTYPKRLFSTDIGISEDDYNGQIEKIKNQYNKLNKYSLFNIPQYSQVTFKEEFDKALKIYFDDFQEKNIVYVKFIEKLDLFTEVINKRLLFKEIQISRDKGIKVIDDHGNNLKLSHLSSGEKHLIVLFFQLIFESKYQLIMIDEPEISQHIVWQKEYMDDLCRIQDENDDLKQLIVATHSPTIIGKYSNIVINLGELYNESYK